MTYWIRGMRLSAVLALVPLSAGSLAGCGLIPPEGPSILAQQPKIDSGPSAQRFGPDGYPLIGTFPKSAAPILKDKYVSGNRSGLAAQATKLNGVIAPGDAAYRATLAETKSVQAQTNQAVDRAIAAGDTMPDAAEQSSEDILREIEGR